MDKNLEILRDVPQLDFKDIYSDILDIENLIKYKDYTSDKIEEEKKKKIKNKLGTINNYSQVTLGLKFSFFQKKEPDLEELSHKERLTIDIVDYDMFVNFLESLKKDIENKPQNDFLVFILSKLVGQFRYHYHFDTFNKRKVDDNFLDFVFCIEKILKEYDRLGLESYTTKLKEYNDLLKKGYIKEYILAKEMGFIKSNDEKIFNYLSTSNPKMYSESWNDFFVFVQKCKENPKSIPLLKEVFENAKNAIKQHRQYIDYRLEQFKNVDIKMMKRNDKEMYLFKKIVEDYDRVHSVDDIIKSVEYKFSFLEEYLKNN
ncbi:MAG: hypothetical protein K9L98_02385 [Candidatus Pacebacteria bacterium]|nr:hypothetical protein [Candidatus Paceibacterota bacterium]MCF7862834.1 hypothetical protein [Candidatus Paceibacterota bacterium]